MGSGNVIAGRILSVPCVVQRLCPLSLSTNGFVRNIAPAVGLRWMEIHNASGYEL